MADLDISYQKVQDAATKIATIKGDIADALQSASQTVDELIGDGFSTPTASEEYNSSFATFIQNAEAAVTSVEQIELFLRNVVTSFTEADTDLAKPLAN